MKKKNNIIIENLSQTKGKKNILRNINLNIPFRKLLCIVGPSGCGKTSLLRSIAGLDDFQKGKIYYNDLLLNKPGFSIPTEKRNFGLMFQESNLFPHLNVFQNVSFGLKSKNFKDIQKKTFDILKIIGLPHFANVYPDKLSSGQKQLVSLARSLVPKPKLLMMDEPFANLDQRLKNKIRDITLHILQKTQTTAIIVTHDPEEAMFMGDLIAVINKGEIIQVDTPDNIYKKPKDSFVARFFGESFSVKTTVKNSIANTIFGKLVYPKFKDQTEVEIVFRSESFNISTSKKIKKNMIKGKIISIKPIGQSTMLHLDVGNKNFSKHIHIKHFGKFIPPKNKICYININNKHTFVFKFKK